MNILDKLYPIVDDENGKIIKPMKRHQNELQRRAFKKGMKFMFDNSDAKFSVEDINKFFKELKESIIKIETTYDSRSPITAEDVKGKSLELIEKERLKINMLLIDTHQK